MLASVLLVALASTAPATPPLARAPASALAPADSIVWQIDPNHSELSFRIRHFVSRVRGTFGSWKGTIIADPQRLAESSVQVVIDPSTIDTNNERRDSDLKSDDFFDVAKFPTITFVSRTVQVAGDKLTITGDLTMRGITRPVVLEGRYNGIAPNPRGDRIGFEASTTINRLDWGITWNRVAEGGGAMLGDDVDIEIAIEAIKR